MTEETQNEVNTEVTENEAAAIDKATQADEPEGEDAATDSAETNEEGEQE